MQKVLQRTANAEKQAARRLTRKKAKSSLLQAHLHRQENTRYYKDLNTDIRAQRQNRREDYELGPLKPRRDVGLLKDVYGTMSQERFQGVRIRKDKEYEADPHRGNIVKGDRVACLDGRDKGKIGKVLDINKETASCTVKGLNMVELAVPEWMQSVDPNSPRVRITEQRIPLAQVRLVVPLHDPETDTLKDVIVERLEKDKFYKTASGKTRWVRYIPGLDIEVEWPAKTEKKEVDNSCDTLRIDVETITFDPTLRMPPVPSQIIDELRNKYSKFRTRHDADFVARKRAEDAQKEAVKLQVAAMLRRGPKMPRPERKMDTDVMIKIGELIARKKGIVLKEDSGEVLPREAISRTTTFLGRQESTPELATGSQA